MFVLFTPQDDRTIQDLLDEECIYHKVLRGTQFHQAVIRQRLGYNHARQPKVYQICCLKSSGSFQKIVSLTRNQLFVGHVRSAQGETAERFHAVGNHPIATTVIQAEAILVNI